MGVGALPDAAEYGDEGSNTLEHIAAVRGRLFLPNLARLGLGRIVSLACFLSVLEPAAAYGKMAEKSAGKDTITGHWEIAGIISSRPFPLYPHGFPPEIIEAFTARTGRPVLGNKPASGTEIIQALGKAHLETGFPIVYTSADSVFQIAAHEEIIPPEELYRYCQIAREILQGEHGVARVIARPFRGEPGNFFRTPRRRDFALPPLQATILDLLQNAGLEVVGVGKIEDLFAGRGLTAALPAKDNASAWRETVSAFKSLTAGLVFTNLIDFDMLYGHRNDVEGYAKALEAFDEELPALLSLFSPADVLIITADHGCDPTTSSTDHSREYVPLLIAGPGLKKGIDLGTRETFADVAATLASLFGLPWAGPGASMASLLT